MPLVCIHCSMKALLDGTPVPVFDETPELHLVRHHPDLQALIKERDDLVKRLDALLARQHASHDN